MVAQQRSLNMRNALAQAQLRAGSLERELVAAQQKILELEVQLSDSEAANDELGIVLGRFIAFVESLDTDEARQFFRDYEDDDNAS